MQKSPSSFVFHREWKEALKDLPDSIRLQVYEAVIDYATIGIAPKEIADTAHVAFNFIKCRIDSDQTHYQEVAAKRSAAGRKHRGNQFTKKEQTEQTEQMFQSETKRNKRNVIDIDIDINNNIDDNKDNTDVLSKKKEKEKESEDSLREKWYLWCIKSFNEHIADAGSRIKRVRTISEKRRVVLAHLFQLYNDSFPQMWVTFCQNAAHSDFVNGRTNRRKSPCDFDWLISEDNFIRIFENSI